MREILYKGKSTQKEIGEFNNVWVKGDLITSNGKYYIHPKNNVVSITGELGKIIVMHEVNPDTACLYTGKTDKNKQKIWENDIIRDADEDMTMVVRWDDEKLMFVLDDYGYPGCFMESGWDETTGQFDVVDTYGFDDFYFDNLSVVGNIIDNPEFLKDGTLPENKKVMEDNTHDLERD